MMGNYDPMIDSQKVEGFLTGIQAKILYELAKESKHTIVEIGAYKGRSTIALAKGAIAGHQSIVYSIDHHCGSEEHGPDTWTWPEYLKNLDEAGVLGIVRPLVFMAHKAAKYVKDPVDLLFIDGSHDYESVKDDFETWSPKVIIGGKIVIHDTDHYPGPARFICEIPKESFRFLPGTSNMKIVEKYVRDKN
ncbi:MAG: hypothetical protein GTO12_26100 [Proteobacteria bacterium]|nr:hypothetical protein [Pseudomonadota bacterium]